jgi:deazaflavin-dependent oxidoreductase (nitroreductase family)
MIQDGPALFKAEVREVEDEERSQWWDGAVAVYPDYAAYQQRLKRVIPVFVARPRS